MHKTWIPTPTIILGAAIVIGIGCSSSTVSPPGTTTGSLHINATGVLGGGTVEVTVLGPSDYSQTVNVPTTLSALEPGKYTILASTIFLDSGIYWPAAESTAVAVRASLTPTEASISYRRPVRITPYGALSVPLNGRQQFAATVANDLGHNGVYWQLLGVGDDFPCQCGTVSPASSANGDGVTYTAPALVPKPGRVGLYAISTDNHARYEYVVITITSDIHVTMTPAGAATIHPGTTRRFTATVTNDDSNAGVTWTLNRKGCHLPSCGGGLSAKKSASGVAITYTAPATVPAPELVSIIATSVTDYRRVAADSITITP